LIRFYANGDRRKGTENLVSRVMQGKKKVVLRVEPGNSATVSRLGSNEGRRVFSLWRRRKRGAKRVSPIATLPV